jgi:predicted house-cleaning NTP pyrophosphatase (Maf/HAM1 superfamily)
MPFAGCENSGVPRTSSAGKLTTEENAVNEEYRKYHASPRMIAERAARNKARAILEKQGRVRKGDGKHVDHKDGNPNNNSPSNLRVISAKANRKKQ